MDSSSGESSPNPTEVAPATVNGVVEALQTVEGLLSGLEIGSLSAIEIARLRQAGGTAAGLGQRALSAAEAARVATGLSARPRPLDELDAAVATTRILGPADTAWIPQDVDQCVTITAASPRRLRGAAADYEFGTDDNLLLGLFNGIFFSRHLFPRTRELATYGWVEAIGKDPRVQVTRLAKMLNFITGTACREEVATFSTVGRRGSWLRLSPNLILEYAFPGAISVKKDSQSPAKAPKEKVAPDPVAPSVRHGHRDEHKAPTMATVVNLRDYLNRVPVATTPVAERRPELPRAEPELAPMSAALKRVLEGESIAAATEAEPGEWTALDPVLERIGCGLYVFDHHVVPLLRVDVEDFLIGEDGTHHITERLADFLGQFRDSIKAPPAHMKSLYDFAEKTKKPLEVLEDWLNSHRDIATGSEGVKAALYLTANAMIVPHYPAPIMALLAREIRAGALDPHGSELTTGTPVPRLTTGFNQYGR